VHPVDPHRPQAEFIGRGDVVEQRRRDVDVAVAVAPVRSKNVVQCACAGLYEPISDAAIRTSVGTPIRSSEASR
jgi:hypothetical protein